MALVLAVAGCAQAPKPVRSPTTPGAPNPPASMARSAAAAPVSPAAPGPHSAATRQAPAAAAAAPLAAEQHWLATLFADTPVRVIADADGSVRVDLPLHHAYAAGESLAQPPLQVVLDHMAQSMRRHPTTRLRLAMPGPAAGERTAAVRQHLQARGVAPHRIADTPGVSAQAVGLVLAQGPPAIERLEDRRLPRCTAVQAFNGVAANGSCVERRP